MIQDKTWHDLRVDKSTARKTTSKLRFTTRTCTRNISQSPFAHTVSIY